MLNGERTFCAGLMGHRNFLGSSQFFDDEHDQGWNHTHPEHPYTSLARSGTSENRSHVYPAENMLNEGMPVSSHWNSSPGTNAYTASGHSVERPHYNPGASGPSHDPFVNSTVPTFSAPNEDYLTFASSSNCNSQAWTNASYVDQSMENVRGAQKRKRPCPSSIYEMGSSSQYHRDRTPTDTHFPSEFHLGKSITHDHDPHYMPWLMNPTYSSNNLSIRGESSSRNVRSRSTLDLETSLGRNNLPRSLSLDSHSTHRHSVDHSGSGQFAGQTSHGNKDWNCARLSSVPRDTNGFSSETNNFLPARSVVNSLSVDTSGYHHGLTGNRNHTVSHGFPGTSAQSTSSSRFSHHRSTPTYRTSSQGSRLGHVASSSGDRSHLVTETYPSRHLRPPPHISWRSGDRPGRRRSSYERFQPPFDEVSLHERFSSEGFMVVDRQPHYYESRNMLDHHRDMRLDIDNMSYEELLALGERIGSVNTGLSDSAISSCLLATTYYPAYQKEDQRKCAICLEEYKEKEELGEVKGCGHDYHGRCIKKWLSMKNSCPICKSPALPDASKNSS
ncbi:probable E3 ubiquitin-protein ligase RHG1A isoform X1 [Arabidopsis lyrata subsp. lyrata]|nr:probable E3 ubiquitin-protein ligase RHG1A isoform X1 [Arabidopsis lyrata subsp. lyrata]XP_020883318.1 probable E3 ubiquitin-protein ligase RHG1A isoform X1 [Arabidopsis lyrata subsp. lyrata]XP_020883319.1 probable E3 ubiquitin-protein ligase RHG1A isoform X1 [Arabidopsis lyrata subsp. lyrata]XP_020883320.1 probable E3 ubiquitin-protein ligase RHG1A isoform X1 [Arabidopsis lyrata subsp. lyrata]XP_020883321.1 probable E3 ubiquitin-protein ligase RHG1A isoform X1 [Arabidopsis lyrata subsp. lyr|eukprot:XP_020883317.1 probable E3 ubiquitin-protein ligase RHG1A isoform X1 [Arabidopsis lyrata subsp. lyrata]